MRALYHPDIVRTTSLELLVGMSVFRAVPSPILGTLLIPYIFRVSLETYETWDQTCVCRSSAERAEPQGLSDSSIAGLTPMLNTSGSQGKSKKVLKAWGVESIVNCL